MSLSIDATPSEVVAELWRCLASEDYGGAAELHTDEFAECEDNDCTNLYDGDSSTTVTQRTVEDNWQHDLQVSYDLDPEAEYEAPRIGS